MTPGAAREDAARVRRAEPDDADAVWPLTQLLATSFTPDHERFAVGFTDLVSREDTYLGVAEVSGQVVGYVVASRHSTLFANGAVGWVEELLVAPHVRRHGVGTALMSAVESWAATLDVAYVSLATRRADAFYTALGYEPSATFYRKVLRVDSPRSS